MSRAAYQARLGVKQPWIGEISGVQLGRMSKRARAQYDARRSAEWGASHECGLAFARECFEAYVADQTILDHESISTDARNAILSAKLRWEEADRAERERRAVEANRISDASEVCVGARVFCIIGREYLRVTKVFKASLRGIGERGGCERKVPAKACQWLSHEDMKAGCSIAVMNLGALLDGPSVPPTAALVQATAEARRIPWRGAEWLPIDTAPNDSKSVILFIPGRGPLVSWRCVPGGAWYAPGPYRGPEEPTHWMPIPTLPIGANP